MEETREYAVVKAVILVIFGVGLVRSLLGLYFHARYQKVSWRRHLFHRTERPVLFWTTAISNLVLALVFGWLFVSQVT